MNYRIIIFFLLLPLNLYAAQLTELGISQLKANQYQQANKTLLQAKQSDEQHLDLNYALALSHFYLKDWQQAKAYFQQNTNPERKYPSLFYLGKIAEEQGDYETAQSYYDEVFYQFEDIEAQASAEAALNDLAYKQVIGKEVMQSPWIQFAMLSTDLNHVDGIVDPNDENLAESSDLSLSLLAAGGIYYVPKASQMKMGVAANVYQERYQDFSDYDVTATSIGAEVSGVGKYPWSLKLAYGYFWLADDPYLANLSLKAAKSWQGDYKQTFSVQLVSYQAPDSDNQHLEGLARQVGYQLASRKAKLWKWKLDLTYRNEAREDNHYTAENSASTSFDNAVTQYSKSYLQAKVSLGWHKSAKWLPSVSAFYRQTEYDGADQFLQYSDDTSLTSQTKQSERVGVSADLAYKVNKNWDINTRYQWVKEDMNLDSYDFENSSTSIGLQYSF